MGSKELSVRQGLAVSNVDQWIDRALNRGKVSESTIEEMLRHPQIKKHGTFGRLSSSQQNIVTSVVSVMQDQVAKDAKNNAETLKEIILAEREALKAMSHSFASTARSLYKLPLIASVKKEEVVINDVINDVASETSGFSAYKKSPANDVVVSDPVEEPTHWSRFFSWGNMISVAAIVLLVLVVKTSVETANFEVQYHKAVEDAEALQAALNAKDKKYEGLQEEYQLVKIQMASLMSDLDGQKINAAQQITSLKESLRRQTAKSAKRELLYTSTESSLSGEIKTLQIELSLLKGKESDQSQTNELWKQLAMERKEELAKLQSQVLALSELSTSKNSDDSGWSFF